MDRDQLLRTLTPREVEVLRLLADGKTNPEIAAALGISFETAKWHVSEILQKLQVDRREDAARVYAGATELAGTRRWTVLRWPLAAKLGLAAATAGVAGILVVAAFWLWPDDNDRAALGEGANGDWLIAYVATSAGDIGPTGSAPPAARRPLQAVNVTTGASTEFGPERTWRAVFWSPRATALVGVAASDDGQDWLEVLLVSYPDGAARSLAKLPNATWHPRQNDSSAPVERHRLGLPPDIAWSPDGSQVALAGPGSFAVFEASGELVAQFEGEESPCGSDDVGGRMKWSPDGERIVQPCVHGAGYVAPGHGDSEYISWEAAGLDVPPFYQDGLWERAAYWANDDSAIILFDPTATAQDPGFAHVLAFSGSNANLRETASPTQPEIEAGLEIGVGPLAEAGAALNRAGTPSSLSPGFPAATDGAWILETSPNIPPPRTTEEFVLFYDGEAVRVELDVTWVLRGEWGTYGPQVDFVVAPR